MHASLWQSAVRVRATAALGAMLALVHERQSTPKYSRIVLDKIEEGLCASVSVLSVCLSVLSVLSVPLIACLSACLSVSFL